jgi:hypothetical protein
MKENNGNRNEKIGGGSGKEEKKDQGELSQP